MLLPGLKRILLKLSGEVLMGDAQFGIDPAYVARLAEEVKAAKDSGLEICLVIGGGNIFRGIAGAAKGLDRTTGDYMGMLATVMNALAMQNALEQLGVQTRVQSAIPMATVCEPLYPQAGRAAPREGADRDLRGGHRQPVLHHRYGRRPARGGDELRRAAQGHQRRRGLRHGPQASPGGGALRNNHLFQGVVR